MRRSEVVIRRFLSFLGTDIGKATVGLFCGVICFCWPVLPGYALGGIALYYAIHQFRPVATWIYQDIRADLNDDMQADASGD
jgi:hypothetical protein